MENFFKCRCCNRILLRNPRVPDQGFCGRPQCQQKRRNAWRSAKLKSDSAYRQAKADAQRRWREKNPDYQREYRAAHPEYVRRNRQQQRRRNSKRRVSIVKRDASASADINVSGVYRLIPEGFGVVKRDALIVRIDCISDGYG